MKRKVIAKDFKTAMEAFRRLGHELEQIGIVNFQNSSMATSPIQDLGHSESISRNENAISEKS